MTAYRQHTAPSSFHWNSRLSDQRKQELIDWVASLSDDEAGMLEDLLQDVRDDEQFYAAESESV